MKIIIKKNRIESDDKIRFSQSFEKIDAEPIYKKIFVPSQNDYVDLTEYKPFWNESDSGLYKYYKSTHSTYIVTMKYFDTITLQFQYETVSDWIEIECETECETECQIWDSVKADMEAWSFGKDFLFRNEDSKFISEFKFNADEKFSNYTKRTEYIPKAKMRSYDPFYVKWDKFLCTCNEINFSLENGGVVFNNPLLAWYEYDNEGNLVVFHHPRIVMKTEKQIRDESIPDGWVVIEYDSSGWSKNSGDNLLLIGDDVVEFDQNGNITDLDLVKTISVQSAGNRKINGYLYKIAVSPDIHNKINFCYENEL